MKKLQGKLRQKNSKGNYYYRLTVANGIRKEFALKTADETEAIQRAEELDSIYAAPNMDVAVAQINAIKGFSKQAQMLPLSEGWAKYEIHPERATPHTVTFCTLSSCLPHCKVTHLLIDITYIHQND